MVTGGAVGATRLLAGPGSGSPEESWAGSRFCRRRNVHSTDLTVPIAILEGLDPDDVRFETWPLGGSGARDSKGVFPPLQSLGVVPGLCSALL